MMHIVDTPEPTSADPVDAGDAVPSSVTTGRYSTDVTTLTERIAIRLAGQGAEHPVAAAVAIAVRGMSGLDLDDLAAELDLAGADVRALEAGAIALRDLPAPFWKLAHEHGLEPVLLVDLDRQLRGGGERG